MCLPKRIETIQPLEMGEYLVQVGLQSVPTFSYKDIVSCSAVLFKGSNGYAAFHYPAQALDQNGYGEKMKEMIKDITKSIGNISNVKIFTPSGYSKYEDNKQEQDFNAICDFFEGTGINDTSRASDIAEVSCNISTR